MSHEPLPSSEEIRRQYLLNGGDAAATAQHFGVSRQTLYRRLRQARVEAPLHRGKGKAADREAVEVYVRRALERVGVEA